MKRTFITIFFLLTFLNIIYSQNYEPVFVFHPNKTVYFITNNLKDIRFDIADAIADEIRSNSIRKTENQSCYSRKNGPVMYSFCFSYRSLQLKFDTTLKFNERDYAFNKGDSVYLFGFNTFISSYANSENINHFLTSAYLQETDPIYKYNPDNFIILLNKNKSEFWKRNMINMGYGYNYIAKDNPFVSAKWVPIGFGYLLEALHYIAIFGGPFFGETKEDKIGIPLIGLGSLLFWKTIVYGRIGGYEIREYNNINNSKYKIPIELIK